MAKISIIDVAKHAGVSTATVSYIINNTKQVTAETKRRVEESIRVLGYKPNMAARSFKTGKKHLIAFVVPDIANLFFATLIEELETTLTARGYNMMILNTKETKQREIENISLASSGLVDGFLIASTLEDYHELNNLLAPSTPAIFIDRSLPNCPHDTIIVDCYDATCQGIEHLIRAGHVRIGFITGLSRISTTKERVLAYETTMKKHGLYDERLTCIGNSMVPSVKPHLEYLLAAKCTAIVIANNIMATEAMNQMLQKGLLLGRDVELLGFKDGDQVQYGLQCMSLVCQPTNQLGKLAGQMLFERLENPHLPQRHTILKAVFTPRMAEGHYLVM